MSLPSQPSSGSSPKSSFGALEPSDTEWFNREVFSHDGRLKAYLRGSFPTVRDVDDLVQQSYIRIWRRQLMRPLESVQGFLYSVARNLAIDAVRREARSPVQSLADLTLLEVLDSRPDAAEAACTNDELDLLRDAIDSLPKRCREVVILRKVFGMSPPEIARKLGISEGTVHLHGAKGVKRCEEFLRARITKIK